MRIYMQLPSADERPPRFYQLVLQKDLLGGWTLIRESGAQGGPGRVQRQHFEDHDSALDALVQWRDRQLRKGYRVVFAEGEVSA